MDILFLLIGITLGFLIGFLVARGQSSNKGNMISLEEFNSVERERTTLLERVNSLNTQHDGLVVLLKGENSKLDQELRAERDKLSSANARLAKAEETFLHQKAKIEEQHQQLEELHRKLTSEFENIASKLLDEKSKKFTEQNQSNLDGILKPLKEKIKDFEEKVDRSYKMEADERSTLKGVIQQLMELNHKISEEANNLTKALKGDTKKQGNWGELVLERILEGSGLVEGEGYVLQGKGMGLTDEEGNRFQPDVVINLPDKKHIIIDSKVSLTAYDRLVNAIESEDRELFVKNHILSIRNHIIGLGTKNYQNLYGINSPDFVLLFIPIESSFSIAIQNDYELFDFAWSKRVVIVTPSTLFATLKTVASIWKQERQTQNALDIANKAGALYDKFVAFVDDLKKIGDNIDRSKNSYNEAYNKLVSGSGNLVGRAEKLRSLGAKTSKQLDQRLLTEEEPVFPQGTLNASDQPD